MLRRVVFAALSILAAAPVLAQTPAPPRGLLGNRTLRPAHVMCTDLPVVTPPKRDVLIKGGHNSDGHKSLVKGDFAVLSAGADVNLAAGQRYVVRRLDVSQPMPRKGEGFGAVRTAGWLTITAVNETTALAKIDFACDPIEPGDFLEIYSETELPTAADPLVEPSFDDRANVLFGGDHRENFGDGDVFSIDRGKEQGITAGARFAIYRDRHDGLPLIHIGDAIVVEPGELSSKVVLVMARDAIAAGDIAIPRRTP